MAVSNHFSFCNIASLTNLRDHDCMIYDCMAEK